jgi:hypothetical protein
VGKIEKLIANEVTYLLDVECAMEQIVEAGGGFDIG